MATVDTIGGTTLPRNNGATIVYGGNIDNSGTVTNAPSTTIFGKSKTHKGHNLPVQRTGANIGTQTALLPGGTFAFNMVGGRVIGKRMTTIINERQVNTILLSGSSFGNNPAGARGRRPSIHYVETTRALGVNTWNYVTGDISKGGTAGNAVAYIDPVGGGNAADSAARPTKAIPGELILHHGGSTPLQDDYNAKTD